MQTASRYPWGKGTPTRVYNAVANDSDKTFTVPAGKIWGGLIVYIDFTTTIVVGDRRIAISISDATPSVVWSNSSTSVQPASLNYRYLAQYGLPNAVVAGGLVVMAGAPSHLLEGWTIRVLDGQAVDPAADDMIVSLHYTEYDA